jgi:hypothetical protein
MPSSCRLDVSAALRDSPPAITLPFAPFLLARIPVTGILGDHQSYLGQDPDWTPSYGAGDTFGIVDLLQTAGVVADLT